MKPNNVKRALEPGKVQIGTWVNMISTFKRNRHANECSS